MTPFDGAALLAMLLAFYQPASAANLRRARLERPEYFAGGELFGTHGDKFRLPDGRVFDLLFDADGVAGGPRYQVIEPGPGGGEDTWPLEPGPLEPADAEVLLPPPLDPVFEDLVARSIGDVRRGADHVEQLAGEMASAAAADDVDAVYEDTAGTAERALEMHLAAFDDLAPSDLVGNTEGLGTQIGDAQHEYGDPEVTAPPDLPDVRQREDRPPRDGDGGLWIDIGNRP